MTAQAARLVLEGASLVLRDAFTAGKAVRAGDSLRVSPGKPWALEPTLLAEDSAIGVAAHSAAPGQAVAVIVAGLARVVLAAGTQDVRAGDAVVPGTVPGLARRATTPDILGSQAKRLGTALEDRAPGKPAWIHVKPPG